MSRNFIPLSLVLLRVLLSPAIAYCILHAYSAAAGGLLVVVILTDLLDGLVARGLKLVTPFGAIADAAADKIFVQFCLLAMLIAGLCTPIIVAVTLLGDISANSLKLMGLIDGKPIHASGLGKAKSALSYFYILVCASLGEPQPYFEIAVVLSIFLTGAMGSNLKYAYHFALRKPCE